MLSPEEREIALKQMEATVDDFYRQAIGIHNHPFIEFAGTMQAYIKTCRRAHEAGIDFTECNRHSGNPLPMECFEIDYLNEKLNCIFDDRIVCKTNV